MCFQVVGVRGLFRGRRVLLRETSSDESETVDAQEEELSMPSSLATHTLKPRLEEQRNSHEARNDVIRINQSD